MVLEQVLYYISTKVTPKRWNYSPHVNSNNLALHPIKLFSILVLLHNYKTPTFKF